MASRIGGGPPSSLPTPAATPDNRLEQMREKQLKELMEMRLASTRNDGEHVLESVARRLRQVNDNPSLRNSGSTTPDPRRPDGQRPDQRVPAQQQPGSSQGTQAGAPGQGAQPGAQPGAPGAPGAAAPGASRESVQDFPRLVADFQRQQGLPATGRLDAGTVAALKEKGIVPQQPPASSSSANAADREPGPRASKEDVTATRLNRAALEQARKQRVDQAPTSSRSPRAESRNNESRSDPRDARDTTPIDRALDPSRLLASLALGGFVGKGKASLEEAIKAFQDMKGLPTTGKVDAQTQEALKQDGHIDANATATSAGEPPSKPTSSDKPVEQKQQVRRALVDNAPTTKNAADRDVVKDPLRPQANTNQQTSTADVAARAPVTTPEGAAAEKARLDTVVAQQAASERGVQEGKGDPQATKGHGEVAGEGAGQKGAGGVSGGGSPDSTAASGALTANVDGPEGDETAVGNAEAGDDDFENEERGNANSDANSDDNDDGTRGEGEHWAVPPLSEQVREALEKIMRDDEGAGPVTYTWDVTFLRPGTYASGQPAEELWHVAVNKATAFDPVWQKAADAIASRMLYGEPDADPPTIDDFILALRRARVR
jgi:hypothetical protein